MGSGKYTAAAVATALVVCAARDLSAHRRDELLQAARVAIAPDRIAVQLDVTPGIELADAVIVRVDRDRDGDFSADEKAAYVSEIMASVTMSIDGTPIEVPSPAAEFPDAARLRTGDGAIRLSSTIAVAGIGEGAHAVSIRNDYRPESSVYLANALAPDGDLIAITRQTRDPLQRELTIDYTIGGKRFATLPLWLFGSGAVGWVLFRTRRPA